MIEVSLLQPINFWKNSAQQGIGFTLNPKMLYRGILPNMANMGSCTMLQFAAGGWIKKQFTGGASRALAAREELLSGLGAGMLSATFGSPLELTMIQQQRKGGSLPAVFMAILRQNIARGFVATAIREGMWTVGYLSIPPLIRVELMSRFPSVFDSDDKARVPGALLGALFACYLSHPVDTIKTCMQGDMERKTYGSFSETSRALYADGGVTAFYRGAAFRYGRMFIAVFLIDKLRETFTPMFLKQSASGGSTEPKN